MIRSNLINADGVELTSRQYWEDESHVDIGEQVLLTVPVTAVHGFFKSATRTTAGTTTLTAPDSDGSLLLTDLIIGGEKQAGSTTEVRFTDGTNTVTIFLASAVDAPPNLAHTFAGRFQGWKDARVDMITVGAGDATVTIGYTKIPTALTFAEWDALR